MRTIRTVKPFQLYLENEENEKGSSKISDGKNLNCCTLHKQSKAMFFISPRELDILLYWSSLLNKDWN